MVDWKPDPNKSCYKCVNHSTSPYPPEYGWQGGLDHDCSITHENHPEEISFLISTIEGAMEDLDTDNEDDIKHISCVLANICPLYTPKEEQSNETF